MADVIQEYLVKLGFTTDNVSLASFSNALRNAASLVDNSYLRMAKRALEFQSAATGVFAAVGGAVIGTALNVADADQEYRLFALHMYTSLPVARELKIALDALGQPLENIMWDPELARRFHQLVEDQQRLTQELGPDFENQMLKIRDVRFEFTRFGVELQYLTMMVVQDLAAAFGTDINGLLGKLREFNTWFIANMPTVANWIATKLKPVLIDVWEVMKGIGQAVYAGAAAFTNLIGLLSGDKSLQGTTLTFDKMATAIGHVVDWLKIFLRGVTEAETALSHLLSAATDLAKGDFAGAKSELEAANKAASGHGQGAFQFGKGIPGYPVGYAEQIAQTAQAYGVDPRLAIAVAKVESNLRQYDPRTGNVLQSNVPGSHAMGMFQLQPGTAKALGVDPTTTSGNILGGILYLKQLTDKYGVQGALEHYYGSKNSAENRAYAQRVLGAEAGINIDQLNITVNAKTDASPKDIADEVNKALREGLYGPRGQGMSGFHIQRNLSEFATVPSWSY
jgi:hypothetical protein